MLLPMGLHVSVKLAWIQYLSVLQHVGYLLELGIDVAQDRLAFLLVFTLPFFRIHAPVVISSWKPLVTLISPAFADRSEIIRRQIICRQSIRRQIRNPARNTQVVLSDVYLHPC
jgi:hypothetical protein